MISIVVGHLSCPLLPLVSVQFFKIISQLKFSYDEYTNRKMLVGRYLWLPQGQLKGLIFYTLHSLRQHRKGLKTIETIADWNSINLLWMPYHQQEPCILKWPSMIFSLLTSLFSEALGNSLRWWGNDIPVALRVGVGHHCLLDDRQ